MLVVACCLLCVDGCLMFVVRCSGFDVGSCLLVGAFACCRLCVACAIHVLIVVRCSLFVARCLCVTCSF